MTEANPIDDNTNALLRQLFETPDLAQFIDGHAADMALPPFHVYLTALCQADGQVPEQVIKRAAIERTYGHQLFNGTRNPSRDKVIQLAFGLRLDCAGTQRLLQVAQKSLLYPRLKRDAAILYCLNHHQDVLETQGVLQSLGLTLLGGD